MTNRKTTRRALVLSLLSLLLCCSMLVGTTFAWFTDSVTSGKNQIVAGNLDIELKYSKDMASWADVEGKTDLVNPAALWEPGHTEVVYLRLTNAGTLVLKYNFGINIANSVIGKSVLGNDIQLADYLKYGLIEMDEKDADGKVIGTKAAFGTNRDAAREAAEAVAKDLAAYSDNGVMNPGDVRTMALVIYMPEEVGNEANYRGTAIPTIDMGVTVFATQKDAEVDSFGSDYDANAGWLGDADTKWYEAAPAGTTEYLVKTAEELAGVAALVNAGNDMVGKTIKLGANINLEGNAWTPIGNETVSFKGTLDGNGFTISNLYVEGKTAVGLVGYANNGGNVKNLTVENAYAKGVDYVGVIMGKGYTDIDNCHVKNATVIATPYIKNGVYDGGAKAGGIVGQMLEGAGNTVTNCSATNVTVYAFRDLGGVAGMIHNNNSASGNSASNITLGYILCDQITADENENAGAIYGRVQASATVSPAKDSAENQNFKLIYAVEGATAASSLQKFIAEDTAAAKTIVLLSDVTGNAVIEQPEHREISVVIDGQGHKLNGQLKLKPFSTNGNDTLTIKNINFETSTSDTDFIWSADSSAGSMWRYAHNVTIENCTFTALGDAKLTCVGARFQQAYNIKVVNCVATNMHSLLQAESCDTTVMVEGCKVIDSKNGVSLNNTRNAVVKNCELESVVEGGYGIRHKGQEPGYGLTVENCTISAFVPVLIRNMTASAYTATFSGTNNLTATNDFGYQIVLSGGDWDNDASQPAAPTGTFTITGVDGFSVFK